VFCKGAVNSREHVYPDWLADELPGEGVFTHELERRGEALTPWRASRVAYTVRHVCRRCNNEWMSELEERSKPVIAAMAKNETFPLRSARTYHLVALGASRPH
jgi:hypothetical protein